MTVARMRSALVAGLFLSLLAVALQGVLSEEEEQIPSEDLCRPYIEKALKDLGTGSLEQTSAEVDQEESHEETRSEEEALADETTEELGEIKDGSVEEDVTAEGSKEEATEEQVEISEEKVEKDEQSDEVGTTESAEISTAQEEETEEEAGDASAEVIEQADSPEKIAESKEVVSDQATAEEEDEKPDEEKSDEEIKAEEEEKVDDEAKSEEEKDEESGIEEEEQGESMEQAEEETQEDARQQASAEASVEEEEAEYAEDRTVSGESDMKDEEEEAQAESAEDERIKERESEEETAEATGPESTEEGEKSGEGVEEQEEKEAMSAEEEEGKSAEDETAEEETKSAEEETKFAEEETKSAEEETKSAEEETKFAEEETKSAEEETKSAEEEATSDQEKEAKSEEEVAKCEEDECKQSSAELRVDQEKSEAKSEEETEEKSEGSEREEDHQDQVRKSRGRREAGDEEDAEATGGGESAEEAASEEEQEPTPEEDLIRDIEIPENLRPRDHINQLLKLDEENEEKERAIQRAADIILRDLKRLYDNAIQPLESMYKYRDLSNRHFGDPEIFSKPLVLFMGPWSGGKSSIINYLLDIEYEPMSLRTGAEPSPAYFNIIMHGEEEEILDGTQLAADWTFSGLQKFGQGMLDRLRGLRLDNKLLEKVNIVEIPGILEIRKQVQRLFPFNDACQWFIDRADIIFLVYDPAKLDVGPETEAILDQLKGREYQTRIILNKADQVKPEELMRVQGALIWNISPLMSSAEPPIMYSTSLWSLPYEAGAPTRLLYAQERAFLRDLRSAINKRVEHKIASARRFAVRVRNHAKMVDCYLTTYYNHKTFFGDKRQISDKIIENPQDYHIYEGLSTLTNISRYDLPDPDVYRDFFRLNPLYDFPLLSSTCTYFRGCPINRLDVAIAYDLPELVGKYKKSVEAVLHGENSPMS
ncbi:PREDICTED: sarcalumenin [Dinoponera quadriceps]|uniref:Sarcalumenin n=1 Tax=Dinoponera quadriceps TaxID=609295 RepID=A0A6P3XDE4_DINQU|nr:PREDICTED: sarcalumenin [Dinoponera quadriceps]